MASSPPVAIITGASSGIGLALTQHLLAKSWSVALLDINPPPASLTYSLTTSASTTLYIRTDASSWDSLATAFARAYKWHNRLDFVALNAGIDDRDDIFNSISSSSDKPPRKPNMQTFTTNLFGPYYGLKLSAHYMSLPSDPSLRGGKIVLTASSAGLHALPAVPQYTATKHGLVGLTRAVAPSAEAVGIRVNAVCPANVATGLAPPGLLDSFTADQFTPMSTMMRAFDELGDFDALAAGPRGEWVNKGHSGQCVEVSLGETYYREEIARAGDEKDKGYREGDAGNAWTRIYVERNRKFAAMDWGDLSL